MAQAYEVRDRLRAAHPTLAPEHAIEIKVLSVAGDRIQDRPLAEIGGKGLFTKEIEDALADGGIDIAVHSMKDVPTVLPDGLEISCILEREDPRDAFFGKGIRSLDDLPAGSVVGSASLRRQALILHRRPDVKVVSFRGNVQTRLRKLGEGEVDATMLAVAGLNRLGLESLGISQQDFAPLSTEEMLPAVAQGAIGLETRIGDPRIGPLVAAIGHRESALRVTAERAALRELDGSCRTPIAAHAVLEADNQLWLRVTIAKPDGSAALTTERRGSQSDSAAMGVDCGRELKADAGPDFMIAALGAG
ncbi:MAG: hydroxymethylbilane synthase [Pseudomonadota bacterium]